MSAQHLGYLKRNGLVEAERCANWMIYRLPGKRSLQLQANLACLQEERIFRDDAARLEKIRARFRAETPACVRAPGAVCAE